MTVPRKHSHRYFGQDIDHSGPPTKETLDRLMVAIQNVMSGASRPAKNYGRIREHESVYSVGASVIHDKSERVNNKSWKPLEGFRSHPNLFDGRTGPVWYKEKESTRKHRKK